AEPDVFAPLVQLRLEEEWGGRGLRGERGAQGVRGDPLAPETELGPLAFEAQLNKVSEYVGIGVEEGGRIAYGGGRPDVDLPGYFFQPTVLTDTTNDMRIAQE
ncbi:hypothetical protein DN545_35840, partial [Burkholderia multivorans]